MKTEMLRLNQTIATSTQKDASTGHCTYTSASKISENPWLCDTSSRHLNLYLHYNTTTIKRCWFLLHPTVGSRYILEIARILSPIPGALQWMWRGGGTIGDQTGWASCFGTIEADPSRAGQGDGPQQIARDLRCFFKKGCWFTPWEINMEPENDGLEDDFPFQLGDF